MPKIHMGNRARPRKPSAARRRGRGSTNRFGRSDPVQGAVGAPLGLEDRPLSRRRRARPRPRARSRETAAAVVPGEIRKPSVGAEPRRAVEVAPRAKHARLRLIRLHGRRPVRSRRRPPVGLAHADHRRAVRRDAAVGIPRRWARRARASPDVDRRRRRRGTRGRRRKFEKKNALRAATPRRHRIVNPGPHVEPGRCQLESRPVRSAQHEHRSSALGRARLDPDDPIVVEVDDNPAEPRVARARRALDRDRRRPRAVRCDCLRHRRITNGSEHVRHERLRAEGVPDAEGEADHPERRRQACEGTANAWS